MKAQHLIVLLILVLGAGDAFSQCKFFTQHKCLPELTPYTNNGQVNTTTLFEGDSADLKMTFYSDQQYRLLVCSHGSLGEGVFFKVKDSDNDLMYDSSEKGEMKFDFMVNSTQDLTVTVIVTKDEEDVMMMPRSGCVSVALGFMNE